MFRPVCTPARGTVDIISSHGIPRDLLDRLLMVRMKPYSSSEVTQIISIRAKTEGITIQDDALQHLSEVAENTSLRYELYVLFDNLLKFEFQPFSSGIICQKMCKFSVIATKLGY